MQHPAAAAAGMLSSRDRNFTLAKIHP